LASKANINENSNVLDMGSGVGGPMRTIAKLTGANITGVTLNQYQVNQCNKLTPEFLKKNVHC